MSADATEGLDAFRLRARSWIRDNLKPVAAGASAGVLRNNSTDDEELAQIAHERELQQVIRPRVLERHGKHWTEEDDRQNDGHDERPDGRIRSEA